MENENIKAEAATPKKKQTKRKKSWLKKLKNQKWFKKYKLTIAILFVVVIPVVMGAAFALYNNSNKTEAKIMSESALEKIVEIADLNTFKTVYKGVTTVKNAKDMDKVDFYVYYEAEITAKLNFDKVKIDKDEKAKQYVITLPPIQIEKPDVDIKSLDFMFMNKKAESGMVLDDLYKLCISDAGREVLSHPQFVEMAEENAVNIIEGLTSPLLGQMKSEYTIRFEWEEK